MPFIPGVRTSISTTSDATSQVRSAPAPSDAAGCWGRNCGRMLEECLRGPAHEGDAVIPGQAGDVDEPDDRLDADRGADGEHELAELLVGEVIADAVERLGDPGDR